MSTIVIETKRRIFERMTRLPHLVLGAWDYQYRLDGDRMDDLLSKYSLEYLTSQFELAVQKGRELFNDRVNSAEYIFSSTDFEIAKELGGGCFENLFAVFCQQCIQPQKKKDWFVYAIIDLKTNLIKIGISSRVQDRLMDLSTANPNLDLLISFPCADARKVEKELHSLWDSKRVAGEWFSLSKNEVKNEFRRIAES